MITAAAILVGLFAAWLLFRTFFDDFENFKECVGYWFTPDIISLFRGEWMENEWASAKIFLYFAICVGSGYGTYWGLHKRLG